MTRPSDSGSSRSPRAVEPVTSQTTTVTTLRAPRRCSEAMDAPQLRQNRARPGHLPAVLLDGQDPVEQQEQLVAGLALLDEGLAGAQPPERRVGADDDGRQPPFPPRLHRG